MHRNKIPQIVFYCCAGIILYAFNSCSSARNLSRSAKQILLEDSAIATGHIGISIYEPASGKYWYNYDAEKNFIPASNTKLFTLYAGMKYLGDSLVGLRYQYTDTGLTIFPSGDPTFLHPDFKKQPALDFLLQQKKALHISTGNRWKTEALGNGWAWNDYEEDYMAERSPFPIYGNMVHFEYSQIRFEDTYADIKWNCTPAFFNTLTDSMFPLPYWQETMRTADTAVKLQLLRFDIKRDLGTLEFRLVPARSAFTKKNITFFTNGSLTTINILKKDFGILLKEEQVFDNSRRDEVKLPDTYTIKTQPTDSLFTPMMHRSDNFFAEQTLLMASNEKLGYMSDAKIIDTLLKTDLKNVPQKPRWVDGSGLSRYNLFTPKSFIYILDKMKNEFGMNRLKVILATGGTGTISSYYKKDSGYIFAKTGTLSNNCALSGFLITKKGKLLIFSILANNYQSGATPVRRAVERFLQGIREKY